MKTNYTYTITCLLLGILYAGISNGQAQLPNSGFEIWETRNFIGTNYQSPQGWYTLNQLKAFGFEETTFESSNAKVGSKAVILETMLGPSTTIPGLLTIQNMLGITGIPDIEKNRIAFTSRPKSIMFWFQSFPEPGDANVVYMLLTKWVDGKRDTIGEASFEIDSIVSNYREASVLFNYYSSLAPDSMSFIASSSKDGFSPTAGSLFLLDDLRLTYSNAINEVSQNQFVIYPNPCSETLQIRGLKDEVDYAIYDMLGNLVKEGKTIASSIFGLNQLASGNYIVNLSTSQSNSFHRIYIGE